MPDPSSRPPGAEPPLRARTLAEVLLYLRIRGATVLHTRRTEDRGLHRVGMDVLREGRREHFEFLVHHLDPEDELHLGGATPSTLLDPADLVLFATKVERELPWELDGVSTAVLREQLRELELAGEAVGEALKFVRKGTDQVPREAMGTAAAAWLWGKDPARFTRSHLVEQGHRLRRWSQWAQEVLRAREE